MSREVIYKWTCPKCGEEISRKSKIAGVSYSASEVIEELGGEVAASKQAHACPTPAVIGYGYSERTCSVCGFRWVPKIPIQAECPNCKINAKADGPTPAAEPDVCSRCHATVLTLAKWEGVRMCQQCIDNLNDIYDVKACQKLAIARGAIDEALGLLDSCTGGVAFKAWIVLKRCQEKLPPLEGEEPEPVKWKVGDKVRCSFRPRTTGRYWNCRGTIARVIEAVHPDRVPNIDHVWVRFEDFDYDVGFHADDPSLARIPEEGGE